MSEGIGSPGTPPEQQVVDELERLSLPFTDEAVPSEAELRIAQAQLVGWLEEMRRQAMPGALPGTPEGAAEGQPGQGPGLYL